MKSKSDIFNKIKTTSAITQFAKKSMDIADQISHYLSVKEISQKELAKQLDKQESEISKWLSGSHNFTIKTISKIESILNKNIIVCPLQLSIEELQTLIAYKQSQSYSTTQHQSNIPMAQEPKITYSTKEKKGKT